MLNRRKFLKTSLVATAGLMSISTIGCNSNNGGDNSEGSKKAKNSDDASNEDTIIIKDFLDKEVAIPANAQRIASLQYNSYGRLLFLGHAEKVVMTARFEPTEWTKALYPGIEDWDQVQIPLADAKTPNVEELAELGCDLVFYWSEENETYQQIERLGIPIVASYPAGVAFPTIDDWFDVLGKELKIFGTAMGEESSQLTEDWIQYTHDTIDLIHSKIGDIADEDRKTIYYMRQDPDGLEAFNHNSYVRIAVEVAGGRLVNADPNNSKTSDRYTLEQITEWDPEFISMGWIESTDLVTENPQWAGIQAVQNDNVFLMPASVNLSWPHDYEMPLSMIFLAKKFFPDKMADVDLVQETIDFHDRFRDVVITREDAEAMLEHRDPPQ